MSFEVETQETLNDQLQVRREKMSQLREKGIDPFGTGFKQKTQLKKSTNNLKELQRNLLVSKSL